MAPVLRRSAISSEFQHVCSATPSDKMAGALPDDTTTSAKRTPYSLALEQAYPNDAAAVTDGGARGTRPPGVWSTATIRFGSLAVGESIAIVDPVNAAATSTCSLSAVGLVSEIE